MTMNNEMAKEVMTKMAEKAIEVETERYEINGVIMSRSEYEDWRERRRYGEE